MEPVVIILLLLVLCGLYGINTLIKENSKRNRKLSLALAYEGLVMKHKLTIEHVEVFDNRIIALDRKNKKLVFVYHHTEYQQEDVISLLEIMKCQIKEDRDTSKGFIKKVYLEIVFRTDEKHNLLCFYDEQDNNPTELLSAVRRARNWEQRVAVNQNPGAVHLESEYVL